MNNNPVTFNLSDVDRLWLSTIGLEREGIRLQSNGRISDRSHPIEWGNRTFHPYLQTDFAECQLELITPPAVNPEEIMQWFSALHQITHSTLKANNELFWPYSLPPHIEDPNQVQPAQLDNQKEFQYRQYLMGKYGKNVQLISGIHFNFQINPLLLAEKIKNHSANPILTTNGLYLELMKKYLYYRWVLTFMLGATPFSSEDYSTTIYGQPDKLPMRSIRQSRYGYQNSPDVKVFYNNFHSLVNSVEENVQMGKLMLEKELYQDVRLRGQKSYRDLLNKGTDYLELRNFDLNPWTPYGMTLSDMYFIKVWLIALLVHDQEITDEDILASNTRQRLTAESHPLDPLIQPSLFDGFKKTLIQVAECLDQNHSTEQSVTSIVSEKISILANPSKSLSGQIVQLYPDFSSLSSSLVKIAKDQQALSLKAPYQLHGFEFLELSTQNLIKQAMTMGVGVSLVDPEDQILKLEFNQHIEFVKNANMTSKDSLISYFIMDNKLATKKILDEHNLRTPRGQVFSSRKKAMAAYPHYSNQAFVIKPKNTNYGLGITLFKEGASLEVYQQAVSEAFQHDKTILIEEYIEGTEIRFYVQDGKVLAACERQSAHVMGDGKHTIQELIDLENKNPLRGIKHIAPLTYLELGPIERLTLKEQNLSDDSIPMKNQRVLLRNNSNVSSGGIAIDRTYSVHPDYLEIAQSAAKSLETFICGVDIIIKNPALPIKDSSDYAILEANYNPMMTLHLFPAQGQAQPLSRFLIEALFPDYPAKPS